MGQRQHAVERGDAETWLAELLTARPPASNVAAVRRAARTRRVLVMMVLHFCHRSV